MYNYDDIINDHEYRLEQLENGGGGSITAQAVSYDDSATSYGESTVQKVLEKIKSLFLPLTGGTVNGAIETTGNIILPNNVGLQARKTDGSVMPLIFAGTQDGIGIGNGAPITANGMLNCASGINGTTNGNALPIIVESAQLSNQTLNANTNNNAFNVPVAKSGYVPVGIVGYMLGGTNYGFLNVHRMYISGSNAVFGMRNTGTSNATFNITVYVLYQLSAAAPTIIE